MKSLVAFALALSLGAALAAQQTQTSTTAPPAQVPPMAAPPTPLPAAATAAESGAAPGLPAALAPNPNALRIYIQALTGPDANQIAGLIEQGLFDSRQVVVTENPNNASLILKGTIYRRPVPELKSAKSRTHRRRRRAPAATAAEQTNADNGGATFVSPKTIPDVANGDGSATAPPVSSDALGSGDAYASSPLSDSADLPSIGSLLNPGITDLSKYQYRLDLELVDPEGDLIWISGRGIDAPDFATAGAAVATSLQPMLALIEKSAKGAPPRS